MKGRFGKRSLLPVLTVESVPTFAPHAGVLIFKMKLTGIPGFECGTGTAVCIRCLHYTPPGIIPEAPNFTESDSGLCINWSIMWTGMISGFNVSDAAAAFAHARWTLISARYAHWWTSTNRQISALICKGPWWNALRCHYVNFTGQANDKWQVTN